MNLSPCFLYMWHVRYVGIEMEISISRGNGEDLDSPNTYPSTCNLSWCHHPIKKFSIPRQKEKKEKGKPGDTKPMCTSPDAYSLFGKTLSPEKKKKKTFLIYSVFVFSLYLPWETNKKQHQQKVNRFFHFVPMAMWVGKKCN